MRWMEEQIRRSAPDAEAGGCAATATNATHNL